jgi:hypothetical protein
MVQRLKLAKQTTGIPVVVLVRQAIDRYLDDLGVAGSSPSTGGEKPVHLKENPHDE